MKKAIAMILALAVLGSLVACGHKKEEPTAPPTTEDSAVTEPQITEPAEPTSTEPDWDPGIARAWYGEGLYKTFEKGIQVNVLGKFKHYYVVEGEEVDLLVRQSYIRMENEEAYETWEGYSNSNTEVFADVNMDGEPDAVLDRDIKITIVDGKDDWYFIAWDEGEGYVQADMVSMWPTGGSGGGGSSGGDGSSGGGSMDGSDVPIGNLTSATAADMPTIHLMGDYYGPEMEDPFEPGMGVILADGTEGYLCLTMRGDELHVVEADTKTVTIWVEKDYYVTLPRFLVQLHTDKPYESWEGYARWNSVIYEEYQMITELRKATTNDKLTVLDELPDCYVVEFEGIVGYMALDTVSQHRYTSNSGGGSGGSSAGPTWSPGKM